MKFNRVNLKDLTIKIGDGLHGSPDYDEFGDYYFINGNNLIDGKIEIKSDTKKLSFDEYEKSKKELGFNTLLVSINGTLGNIARYNNEKIILGKSACYLNFKDDVNVDYMRFYFMNDSFQDYLKTYANGSTIKNVPLSAIRDCEVSIPDINNQNKIVKCLKSLDDKIKLNNKINNNLQEMVRKLYFEKFDKKIHNGRLGDILNLKKDNVKVGAIDDTFKYYPIDTLPMNYLVIKDGKPSEDANSSLQKFSKYDILLGSMRVYFHRVCLASNDGITRNTTFVMKPIKDFYLYYCLLTLDKNEFIEYASKTSKGSTMPYAVWSAIANYDVYVPIKDELEEFNNITHSLIEKMMGNERENKNLIQLRDTLLPKLMNGEIDLENIEI